jgi:hypothetical protein
LHVDHKDWCCRAGLLQNGCCFLGAARLAHDQFDVSQLLFGPGQASFHGLYLRDVGSPIAVYRYGCAGKDDADS